MCEKFAEIKWRDKRGGIHTSTRIFPYDVAQELCRDFNKLTKKEGGHHEVFEVPFKLTEQNIDKFTFVHSDKCPCFDKIQGSLRRLQQPDI